MDDDGKIVRERRRMPPDITGASSELKVAADLLERGFFVFRSVSRTGPCDLVAVRGKKILRVEVKTSSYRRGAKFCLGSGSPDRFDLLAVVRPDGIRYLPEAPGIDGWRRFRIGYERTGGRGRPKKVLKPL